MRHAWQSYVVRWCILTVKTYGEVLNTRTGTRLSLVNIAKSATPLLRSSILSLVIILIRTNPHLHSATVLSRLHLIKRIRRQIPCPQSPLNIHGINLNFSELWTHFQYFLYHIANYFWHPEVVCRDLKFQSDPNNCMTYNTFSMPSVGFRCVAAATKRRDLILFTILANSTPSILVTPLFFVNAIPL